MLICPPLHSTPNGPTLHQLSRSARVTSVRATSRGIRQTISPPLWSLATATVGSWDTPPSHLTGPSLPAPAPLGAPLACTLVNPDASAVPPAQAWPLLASQPHLNAQPAPPAPLPNTELRFLLPCALACSLRLFHGVMTPVSSHTQMSALLLSSPDVLQSHSPGASPSHFSCLYYFSSPPRLHSPQPRDLQEPSAWPSLSSPQFYSP